MVSSADRSMMEAVCGVRGRCRLTMSLWASSSGSVRQSVCRRRRCWCAAPGPHGRHHLLDTLRDIAVADQADGAAADIADGLTEAGVGGQPARRGWRRPVPAAGAWRRASAAPFLGRRRRVGPWHVGHRDPQFGGGVDVDGVDARAEFVHEAQVFAAAQILAGQRPQHVPHRVGPRQFAVQGLVVVLATPPDVEPIPPGSTMFTTVAPAGSAPAPSPPCGPGPALGMVMAIFPRRT